MMKTGYVATIGMFDGVHLGHQYVLQQVTQTARERGLQSMAITFDHTLRKEPLLTTLNEKLALLQQLGIERTEVLAFTDSLKQMTAREFMQQVLKERLDVRVLLIGYDNRFGRGRSEGFDDYVLYGNELGIDVVQLSAQGTVCSSLIRQQLKEGRVAEATHLLGHPYLLEGCVEHGEHIGTRLGYPTANLMPEDCQQLIPASGVYAVRVALDHQPVLHAAMMNIGHRPTFDGQHTTLEVHVLHLNDNLYGHQLTVHFIERLRDERRFDNEEALIAQLQKDLIQTEKIL
jgi:riboflavin kinase/FMN adenylyltransferase